MLREVCIRSSICNNRNNKIDNKNGLVIDKVPLFIFIHKCYGDYKSVNKIKIYYIYR